MKIPRIKKNVIFLAALLIIIIAVIGIFLIMKPAIPGMHPHAFDKKEQAEKLSGIGTAAGVLSLPMNEPLVADFSAAPVESYLTRTLQFVDTSRGNPTSWAWDFGDNTSSVQHYPVHTYSQDGIYNVTLTVSASDGYRKSVTRTNILSSGESALHEVLVDTLRIGTVKKGSSITFISGNDASTVRMNGEAQILPNGSVVMLRVNSDSDGLITLRHGELQAFSFPDVTLFVNGKQVAQGQSGDCVLPGYRNYHASVTFSIVPTKGEVRQILLDGQKIRAGEENSHITILYDTSDTSHDLTAITQPAYYDGPASGFTLSTSLIATMTVLSPLQGNAPYTVSFRDDSAGSPESWHWDFGDGTISYDQNPVHVYPVPGSYRVQLIVKKGDQTDSYTLLKPIVSLPPMVVANFTARPTRGPAPLNVHFTDLSTGAPQNWNWGFGTNATPASSTAQNPEVLFTEPGTYTIWLSVNNIYGSNDMIKTKYITITDPYRFPDTPILVKTGKMGYVEKDSSIRFTVEDTPASISINGGSRQIPKGSVVSITALSDQTGEIYVHDGKLLKFSFPDMALSIDGDLVAAGPIDSIYIPYMKDFDTAISYYLPPDSAWTLITMDNYKVLSDLDNAWIRISNLGMDPQGSLSLTASANSTYISGAVNQTVYDWVIV